MLLLILGRGGGLKVTIGSGSCTVHVCFRWCKESLSSNIPQTLEG